ncbi:hypothetical protein BSZ35_17970 [Salinibacter sp. 10B]|nr:hypothetical protein BSZ35_17970 [Salinibacter sp. 10B]
MASRRAHWQIAAVTVLMLAFFLSGCVQSPVEPLSSLEHFTAHLNRRVPELVEQYQIPGASMALIHEGTLVWSGAYGTADAGSGRKMTVEAVCRVESISKSVTAWAVMRLVEDGRIDLDAPVHQYLEDWTFPDTEYAAQKVTVRQLLSHTAGLPLGPIGKGAEYAPQSSRPSLRDYLTREARLIRPPGSEFLYSNVGFNLLELLIEEVSGRDFATHMEEEVLRPLGMRRSTFAWRDSLREYIPMGYEGDGTPVAPYVYPVRASGGLLAPVEDIARFLRAEMLSFGDEMDGLLSPESIRMLHAPQTDIPGLYGIVADGYGFGHFVEVLPDSRQAAWHGGQGHGWMSHFHLVPESGDGIVLLTNSERSWPFFAHVLTAWSTWRGFGGVKLGRITDATTALWGLIGLLVIVSLWLLYRLVWALRTQERRFAPLERTAWIRRLLQAVGGIAVLAVVGWSATQPYLIVTSIFPATAGWAGLALCLLAATLIVSASYPRRAPSVP